MTQYAVMIFEGAEHLPPEVLEAHGALPGRVAEQGGKIVAGMALQPAGTATSIRGDLLTDGPFLESKEGLAGVFVLEARDLDHALALAKLTPIVKGGVEVRPLPTRTVASGRSCSPRRRASRATWTLPRSACRRRTSPHWPPGSGTASRTIRAPG